MAFLTIAVVIGSLGLSTGKTLDKPPGFYENSTLRRCIYCSLYASFLESRSRDIWPLLFLTGLSPMTSWFSRRICLASRYISTDLGLIFFKRNLFSISFGYVHSEVRCTFSRLISISVSSCFPYFETFASEGYSLLHLVIPPPSLLFPGMFCRDSTNLFCSINQIVFQVLPTFIQSFTSFIFLD